MYNRYLYDSKHEAEKAMELDSWLSGGKIKEWKPQFPIIITINNQKLCTYYVDFWILHNDKSEEIVEIKSKPTMTNTWRLKWKATKILFGGYYKMTVET